MDVSSPVSPESGQSPLVRAPPLALSLVGGRPTIALGLPMSTGDEDRGFKVVK